MSCNLSPVLPFWILNSLAIITFGSVPSLAQVPSRVTIPPPQDIKPPNPSPTPSSPPPSSPSPSPGNLLHPQPAAPLTPEPSGPTLPDTNIVKEFKVVGSTVFTKKDFDKKLACFTGKPITFNELLQAGAQVTELYREKGYVTSGAVIPPQTAEGGVVTIKVIENEVEEIRVTGTKRLNPNYVRSRLAIAATKPLNTKRLLEALQILQLNPLIKNISAELSAGTTPGKSLLQVKVQEAKTLSTDIILDNSRSPSVGSFQRAVRLTQANLLGQGDALSVDYINTDGSNGGDISYTYPINPRNGTLSFRFNIISSNVIEHPFNVLDINADSQYYELSLRQPVLQTPTEELALGATLARRTEKATYIQELRAPFPSPGADDHGNTRIIELRLFQEWSKRRSQEVLALRSQFSFGLGIFDATINNNPPDGRFFLWQGQVQWLKLLAPETPLVLRGNIQFANRALPPVEQFGLGGQSSVRGYRQDLLLADNGVLGSAEVRLPIIRTPERRPVLQLIPFFDVGTVFNSSSTANPSPSTLVSVGLGALFQPDDHLTARIDYGIPLIDLGSNNPSNLPSKVQTWQEDGFYFSVVYSFF